MTVSIQAITDWIEANTALFWWLTAAGVGLFVLSLVLVPFMVARIPADYFAYEERPPSRLSKQKPVLRIVLMIGKNLLGVVFLAAGVSMLVLPGQGLLTIILGLLLLDIPGKYRAEQWLFCRAAIRKPVNWIREKSGREPLRVRETPTSDTLPST